jgi:hypothetical protein
MKDTFESKSAPKITSFKYFNMIFEVCRIPKNALKRRVGQIQVHLLTPQMEVTRQLLFRPKKADLEAGWNTEPGLWAVSKRKANAVAGNRTQYFSSYPFT